MDRISSSELESRAPNGARRMVSSPGRTRSPATVPWPSCGLTGMSFRRAPPRRCARWASMPGSWWTASLARQRPADRPDCQGGTAMKWITREGPKIDRIASPWLIARLIDDAPEFLFVPAADVMTEAERNGAAATRRDRVRCRHVAPRTHAPVGGSLRVVARSVAQLPRRPRDAEARNGDVRRVVCVMPRRSRRDPQRAADDELAWADVAPSREGSMPRSTPRPSKLVTAPTRERTGRMS